ncbi:MAG: glycosyltransferase family 4 protein [Peptococcaceae bacterium]
MRIAMISTEKLPVPNIKGGAIQTYLTGILGHLPKLVRLSIFSSAERTLPFKTAGENWEIYRIPGESWGTYYENVLNRLQEKDYDLIHIFNRPGAATELRKHCKNTAVTLSVHSDFLEEGWTKEELKELFPLYDGIVTVSKYLTDKIINIFPAGINKVRHIYEGVDTEQFYPRNEKAAEIRASLNLKDEKIILGVGRLTKEKGLHLLVQALPEVLKFFPKSSLVLVGNSRFIDEAGYLKVLDKAVNFPREKLLLFKNISPNEIHRFYAIADIFANPCQWEEPLGRVHYEAMAAGLPIITTPKGGNAEVIKDGYNGVIVNDYQDPQEFANTIINLLRNESLLKSLAANSRRLSTQHFTWKRVALELKRYFQDIIEANNT